MSTIPNPVDTRSDFILVIKNIMWQSLDKIIRVATNIFVLGYVVRYLAINDFGQINYIYTIITLLSTLASLGTYSLVLRNIALDLPNQETILNRAITLQVISSSSIFLLVCLTCILFPDLIGSNSLYFLIFAVSILVKPIENIRSWFEGKMIPLYSLISDNIAFFLASFIKIYLVLTQAPLVYFVITFSVEIVISSLVLLYFFLSRNRSYKFRWLLDAQSIAITKEGLPLLLSALGIFIYMRIDHIMIKTFLGYEAVGIFSAALKFVEIWFAIPIFVSIAISALVMRKYNDKKVNNETNLLSNLFYYSSAVATVISVLITLLSSKIVIYVFGPKYIEAAAILRISIWSIIFIFIGQISANWYIAKGLNVLNMKRILWSVVINILGNYFLLPTIGLKGAAISTLCSQAYATWLGDFFHVETRELFWQKTQGIFLWPFKVINITKSALKIYF